MNRLFTIIFLLLHLCAAAQNIPAYKNATLPVDIRVKDLLSRMTPEEKFWQLFMISEDFGDDTARYKNGIFGFQLNATANTNDAAQQMMHYDATTDAARTVQKLNSIQRHFVEHTRLGIPVIFFNEALHGIIARDATVYPQSIALAATFDTALVHHVACSVARQTKLLGVRQVLGPVINIATDVRWGRTEETYGEDPFLASEMGVAYVSAFEQNGIITTPKHFIANVADGGRDSYPAHIDERTLEEIFYPPFIACIKRGGARSVMSSYNSLNGVPCSMNGQLLLQTLKRDWDFKGFVISDAGAVGGANVLHYTSPDYPTSGRQAIDSGMDVIFQTSWDHYKLFIPHIIDGSVNAKQLDDAVSRVLKAKFELGLFDHPYVPEPKTSIASPVDKQLARKAAQESMVLLKNNNSILPLSEKTGSIAVIGTDAVEARMGGYSGPGNGKTSILDGIRNVAGNRRVLYAPGCERRHNEWTVIPDAVFPQGLTGSYFTNITLNGKPAVTRTDRYIDFHWTFASPDEKIDPGFFSVQWTGKLKAPSTGDFNIGLDGNDGFRLYIDNQLIINNWTKRTHSTLMKPFHFEQDKDYDIRVDFYEPVGNGAIKLIWNTGIADSWQEKIAEAVATVQKADVAIVTVGIEEGEFRDRAYLSLPGHQEELIRSIAATGKPVVVVLVGGSAVTMNNWIDKVPAVLDVWYPGEEGGNALAAILFGKVNPSGRLPVTFPLTEGQLPLAYNHQPTGRGDDYDNSSGLPLFPFGYGLSYTNFTYSHLVADKKHVAAGDSLTVNFSLKNTGGVAGDEVVQLYIRDVLASVARPVMELKAFQRVHLEAGEVKKVSFRITPSMLEMLNGAMQKVVEPGDFRIMIGASSRDIRLKEVITVD